MKSIFYRRARLFIVSLCQQHFILIYSTLILQTQRFSPVFLYKAMLHSWKERLWQCPAAEPRAVSLTSMASWAMSGMLDCGTSCTSPVISSAVLPCESGPCFLGFCAETPTQGQPQNLLLLDHTTDSYCTIPGTELGGFRDLSENLSFYF